MQIVVNLPHVFRLGANSVENARVLKRLLDFMVNVNMDYMRDHPGTPDLYRSGVIYARTTWWEPIPALYARKKGDCKSLATALVAQKRLRGIPCRPVFRFHPTGPGTADYHILVQTQTGFEDPSKILGMGQHEIGKFYDGEVPSGKWY